VEPGDVLRLHVKKERSRDNVWRFNGKAFVGETLAAEAVFTAMIVFPSKED
jgi:3-hydroxyacyl-[acyl-carrier-protein] dehydratase